jgi:hypothetical protein
MIVAKIDVNKIDVSKLFPGKNGAKYLDVCLIETPNNQYGDSHMVVQSVSKEERAAGIKGAILGNAKTIGQSYAPTAKQKVSARREANQDGPDAGDVPW